MDGIGTNPNIEMYSEIIINSGFNIDVFDPTKQTMKTKLLSIIIVAFTLVCNSQNYQDVEEVNDACETPGIT